MMYLPEYSLMPYAYYLLSASLLYTLTLILYRLFLHPLAGFPGSKWSAATSWYEKYYQLWYGPGGQFIFKVEEWHQTYGPIVRITPNELHIRDPDFYETIYSQGTDINKPEYVKWQLGSPGAMSAAPGAELHRLRRSSLNPFFSKRKIIEQEDIIRRQVNRLCERLQEDFQGKRKILGASYMFASMSVDIMTDYAFGRSYKFLNTSEFRSPFIVTCLDEANEAAQFATQFPSVPKYIQKVPESLLVKIMPSMAAVVQFRQAMREQVLATRTGSAVEIHQDRAERTIFKDIYEAKLPLEELQIERLADEAGGVVAAALETTQRTLNVILYHILANRALLSSLMNELNEAIPDLGSIPPVAVLEKLTYLKAVIEEGLRLGYGTVARSPRIHKTRALAYNQYIIPPGTPVSTSTYTMHHNEDVFPDSHTFDPSRWLNNPTGPDGKKPLTRYMTAFYRGTRMCLGWQLAYAIMEVALATLLVRFEFELYETTEKDVKCVRDMIVPGVEKGSKGVRLRVSSRRSRTC